MRPPGEKIEGRLLTFRSVGWVLVLAVLVTGAVGYLMLRQIGERKRVAFGDGKRVETYRFALTPSLIPRGDIVPAMPREGIGAMVDPRPMFREEMEVSPDRKLRKLLVPSDRVIGVTVAGESRAYPLRILNWHEVANDTLGGRPIAVTFHPLTDGVAVFDRTVDGEVRVFAVSGLLWNSSQLLFIRGPEPGGESLWSQLLACAVTGPDAAAGRALELVPFSLTTWGEWRERHPETTVLRPDPAMKKQYPRRPYSSYVGTRKLRFPVSPYPPPTGEPWERAVLVDGEIRAAATVAPYPPAPRIHAFRWALYATRPQK